MSDMRSKHYVIGFGGAKGAGKDTAAHMLAKELSSDGTPVTVMGMSDVLRDAIRILNPLIVVPNAHTLTPNIIGPNRSLNELMGDAFGAISPEADSDAVIWHYTYLEDALAESLGLTPEAAYTELKRVIHVREFLQKLGTEVGRDLIHPAVWVEVAARRIHEGLKTGHVIVTGIRFPNELAMFEPQRYHNDEAFSVYVDRDTAAGDMHASETSVSPKDFELYVDNSGTLEELEAVRVPALRQIIDGIANRRKLGR
jgi:hypothetical protein